MLRRTFTLCLLTALGLILSHPTLSFSQIEFRKHVIDSHLSGAYGVYAADVDRDGRIDIVTASTGQGLNWYKNQGGGSFSKRSVGSFSGAWGCYAEDVDGDGDVDILGASSSLNEIAWWENNGRESFTKHSLDTQFNSAETVFAADLDGDGDVDILGAAWGIDQIAWWENRGRNDFRKHVIDDNLTGAHSVFAADIDGDGDNDVVAGGASATVWYTNNGSGSFSRRYIDRNDGGLGVRGVDVNGDRRIDVLRTARESQDIDWFRNSGGGFSKSIIERQFGNSWSVAGGDVDGDGDIDVVSGGIYNNTVAFWENDGRQNFSKQIVDDRFDGVRFVDVADFDKDGDADIVAVARDANELAWWEVVVKQAPPPADQITVSTPNGGEKWTAGTTQQIQWTSQGSISNVKIEYSTDGGSTWTTIAGSTANDGSYSWDVPNTVSSDCWVRISDASDGNPSDTNDASFSIVAAGGEPVLTLRTPNGGERWRPGSTQLITWDSQGDIASVKLEYSSDNGATWTTIVTSTANDGEYSWTTPLEETESALVRVADAADGIPADASDGPFAITSAAPLYLQRVNAGGSLYTDQAGNTWAADKAFQDGSWGFVQGKTYHTNDPIAGTNDDALYQTERYGMSEYRFSVPAAGQYRVDLHFAEIYLNEIGGRVFDVYVEGTKVLDHLDIYSDVGHDAAMVRSFEVEVTDGVLNIVFGKITEQPKISAIEVESLASDETPPQITDVMADTVTTTTAKITWTTDEAADSQVEFGVDSTYGNLSELDSTLVTSHEVLLTGLNPGTTYHYRVRSHDGSGNLAVSADSIFTTAPPDTTPPVITDVAADQVTGSTATIMWTTDEAADSQVEYGLDTTYGSMSDLDSLLVTSHRVPLSGLQPDTTYHYRVLSRDASGNLAVSVDDTFRTTAVVSYTQRVNAGGSSYTDAAGNVWAADQAYTEGSWGYVGGGTYDTIEEIANTSDDSLYQTERYGLDEYRFTLPQNGRYHVELHFAEIFVKKPGARVFDVFIEGKLVLDDLDIYKLVGRDAAMVRTFEVEVTDGILNISFGREIEEPKVSAILVQSVEPDTTPPVISDVAATEITASAATITWQTDEPADSQVEYGVDSTYGQMSPLDTNLVTSHRVELTGLTAETTYHYRVLSRDESGNLAVSEDGSFTTGPAVSYVQRVNAGGSSYTDVDGNVWDADQEFTDGGWGYVGGRTYSTKHGISGTDDDALYRSERFGMSGYRFTVPSSGKYRVELHFAEIFMQQSGQRIFDVYLENKLVLDNLDIYAEVGHDAALVRTFDVEVTDGVLDVTFEKVVDRPKISAIQVTALPATAALAKATGSGYQERGSTFVPKRFSLSQNYPNPFNLGTRIDLALPESGHISAVIYNIRGQEVKKLRAGDLPAGFHALRWDGSDSAGRIVGSGIYFLRVLFEGKSGKHEVVTRRLVLTK